jgi:hypothetical protein
MGLKMNPKLIGDLAQLVNDARAIERKHSENMQPVIRILNAIIMRELGLQNPEVETKDLSMIEVQDEQS